MISGVWLPIVTPFVDGAVDFAGYERLLEHYLGKGVSRGVSRLELDGRPVAGSAEVVLADDGAAHGLRVILGKPWQV